MHTIKKIYGDNAYNINALFEELLDESLRQNITTGQIEILYEFFKKDDDFLPAENDVCKQLRISNILMKLGYPESLLVRNIAKTDERLYLKITHRKKSKDSKKNNKKNSKIRTTDFSKNELLYINLATTMDEIIIAFEENNMNELGDVWRKFKNEFFDINADKIKDTAHYFYRFFKNIELYCENRHEWDLKKNIINDLDISLRQNRIIEYLKNNVVSLLNEPSTIYGRMPRYRISFFDITPYDISDKNNVPVLGMYVTDLNDEGDVDIIKIIDFAEKIPGYFFPIDFQYGEINSVLLYDFSDKLSIVLIFNTVKSFAHNEQGLISSWSRVEKNKRLITISGHKYLATNAQHTLHDILFSIDAESALRTRYIFAVNEHGIPKEIPLSTRVSEVDLNKYSFEVRISNSVIPSLSWFFYLQSNDSKYFLSSYLSNLYKTNSYIKDSLRANEGLVSELRRGIIEDFLNDSLKHLKNS